MKFKLKTPKIKKLSLIRLLRFLPTVTLIILLVAFGFTIYFLYQYFYQSIAQAKVVSILKNQVTLNQVNMPLYQKVLNAWEIKKQFDESSLENVKDSFRPLPIILPTSNTEQPTIEEVNTP
ncbi:MAG: hypothetical protein UV57_C0002G0019 [Parcubacteria group bacterium GW2011_GWD2_43_10]|uniref:Uncharacterized protein n=5 Tax=Candidatus Vebleniibacteriota TaxID=1817921 RepID=A0A1G2Q7C0_9BACT|nr:MAG: hypothetical protein UV47_C0004G0018 [Parcubacteria group bacterium GW2011_GWA2_42_80]KKS79639.1 MAG: hypothetical protein UV52_C0005G0017 [Parcubacteria group bacterium GW2011_GWD1_42_9]KKS84058.1 MAG: hypothetical protein UV57_C0002G0019 [Parcubacteria group bacterium GW2011_GWD2_43_10]KKS93243.1 MAG: hypothetical protein UV69_C0010G0015 [Parcubacteria group bacterium GW2011_GWE2_43_12]KKT14151.1 MAG: hypothetical protein UV92_C0005G0014 [Parcubacteria group bacterium GW2011_GWA1_43_2